VKTPRPLHFAPLALAAATDALAQEAANPVSAFNLMQVLLGLTFVLCLVGAAAWLMRRFGPVQPGAGKLVRVLGGAAVGARERVVLIEVADTWIVVGVGPGQVRPLATLPRGELPPAPPAGTPTSSFTEAMKRVLESRRAG
jgi:flagellar protein FliO/FliZ